MFEELQKHREDIQNNILKSFENDIEKAHVDGEMHPNGKWHWVSSAAGGKGDWRVKKPSVSSAVNKPEEKPEEKKDDKKEIYKPNGYMTKEFLDHLTKNKSKIWPSVNFDKYSNVEIKHVGSPDSNYISASGVNDKGVRMKIVDAYITGDGTNFGTNQVWKNDNIKKIVSDYQNDSSKG